MDLEHPQVEFGRPRWGLGCPSGSFKFWILLLLLRLSHKDPNKQDTLERWGHFNVQRTKQGQGTGTPRRDPDPPGWCPLTCCRQRRCHSCVSMLSSSSPAAGSSWFSSSSSPSFFSGGFSYAFSDGVTITPSHVDISEAR